MKQAQSGLAVPDLTPASRWRVGFPSWLVALAVGCVAMVPRCFGLADFFTIDEPYHWIGRVREFSAAVSAHRWAATDLTGHPGVTTMWLGGIGRALAHRLNVPDEHSAVGPTTAYLALLRLPVAVTNSIAVAIAYPLLCRLVGARVALLAALMLATSPFLIGFSRVLHVDGLLTSFSMLSILLLLVATNEGRRMDGGDGAADRAPVVGRWWLVGSGVCAGLAALSKAPALVLLPWAGLLLLFTIGGAEWRRSRTSTAPARWAPAIGRVIGLYLLWLGCAVLMFFALWPAMWVAPLDTFADVVREIFLNGGEPHAAGNYFLGEAVPDPGWRFYPVAALLRSTPVMLPGLLALPFAFWGPGSRAPERLVALALLSFAVLFTVAVSFAAKKFDRYMLPAWPALEIAAAIGLAGLGRWVTGFLGRSTRRAPARWPDVAAILAIGALLFAIDMWYHPYEIAYYNPLLGGGATAERIILVGWGEGLEDVGAWLRQRPDLERAPVLSWIPPTLSPFLPRSVQVLDIREETVALRSPAPLYAVLYTRASARAEAHGPEVYIRQTPPLFTVRKYGITYATVHQLPRPYDTAVNALFGDGLALRGYGEQRIAGTLTISPSWDVRRDQPGGLNVFVHVLAADGRRVAQVDAPIDDGLYPTWQAGQQFGTPLPIALPRDLPAGSYRVVLGVYRAADGARLPLGQAAALPPEVDGPEALLLTTLTVP